jgi:hypothetical protein
MVETPIGGGTMVNIMERLGAALNDHDLDAFVSLFATDYQSDQPAHPTRSFSGADKVRENWSSVFAGIRDLKAELLTSATAGEGVELGEWYWHGTYLDGSLFAMRGVILLGVRDQEIIWGRLYMEPVERDGIDIDEMVRETYRPPE